MGATHKLIHLTDVANSFHRRGWVFYLIYHVGMKDTEDVRCTTDPLGRGYIATHSSLHVHTEEV